MWRPALAIIPFVLWITACPADQGQSVAKDLSAPPPADSAQPASRRIVAIGDLHGDLAATRKALTLAGAIDSQDRWIGGSLVVIQTGDHLDRGKEDRAVFDLLEALRGQAQQAGGELIILLGNHEAMNVQLDLRYITPEAFAEFADIPYAPDDAVLNSLPADQRGRAAAFRPGGQYALLLAQHKAIVLLEETLFVHGGVLPSHAELGIDAINQEVAAWIRNEGSEPTPLTGEGGPLWDRTYGDDATPQDCALLKQVLTTLSAKRMVVGHQPYPDGISPACDEALWRIDTGMSSYYGGIVQVLQIQDGETTVIGD